MLQVTESSHLGFPSTRIRTKYYDAAVVPGIGGRIMEFGANGVNLLYQNPSLTGHRPRYKAVTAEEMRIERRQSTQLLYGGEKTWLAPQADWGDCPFADLDHGEYELSIERSENAVMLVLTSPVCRETKLQIVRTLTCTMDKPYIDFRQQLINHSSGPVTKGLWQVTMLNRDGIVDVPDGANVRSGQPIPLYHAENATPTPIEKGWRMDIRNNSLYKLGFMTDAGWTTARHQAADGTWYRLTKSYPVEPNQPYPHHTVVEVYNASEYPYYELEVHSPAYTLQPGESASFTVRWELRTDSPS